MNWLKPKSVENYTGMESEEPFGDEMLNFDVCGTVFKELFKDIDEPGVDAKTETAASNEDSGRKRTENEQNKRKRSIVILEDICTGISQWCKSLVMTKSRIFNRYCWTWSEIFVQSFECGGNLFSVRQQTNLVQRRQFHH